MLRGMSNLGWIIPTHLPRKRLVEELIETYHKHVTKIDLHFVFSRRKENYIESDSINCIFLEDYFSETDIEIFELTGSIINVKKLFVVQLLANEYRGLIVTDDEIEFIREINGDYLLNELLDEKVYLAQKIEKLTGGKTDSLRRVLLESSKMFVHQDDREAIKAISSEFELYSWFSNLPFYDCEDLPDFFRRIELTTQKDYFKLTYFSFDHVLYQYHKIIRGERNLREVKWKINKQTYNLFECMHYEPLNLEAITQYRAFVNPRWISGRILIDYFPEAIVLFHKDRQGNKNQIWLQSKHHLKGLILVLAPWFSGTLHLPNISKFKPKRTNVSN